ARSIANSAQVEAGAVFGQIVNADAHRITHAAPRDRTDKTVIHLGKAVVEGDGGAIGIARPNGAAAVADLGDPGRKAAAHSGKAAGGSEADPATVAPGFRKQAFQIALELGRRWEAGEDPRHLPVRILG